MSKQLWQFLAAGAGFGYLAFRLYSAREAYDRALQVEMGAAYEEGFIDGKESQQKDKGKASRGCKEAATAEKRPVQENEQTPISIEP